MTVPSNTLELDRSGWVRSARHVRSPHCDARPQDASIDLLVIHGISLPPGEFGGPWIEALFTGSVPSNAPAAVREVAHLRVSAHFLIRRDGELVQFVACGERAWHAGQSAWHGRTRCNDFSIGIELEGSDTIPYTARQYDVLIALVRCLCAHYPLRHAVGHDTIAPGRKTDPGAAFDWARLMLPFCGRLDPYR